VSFLKDLDKNQWTQQQFHGKRVVLDFLSEGQDPDIIKPLINLLYDYQITNIAVMFNAIVDVKTLSYPAVSIPAWLCNQCEFFDKLQKIIYDPYIDRKFLCLMRTPSASRSHIAKFLANIESARYSFGSMYDKITPWWVPDSAFSLPFCIPKLIDGPVNHSTKESNLTSSLFRSCFFNLVVETSAQNDLNRWTSVFLTEKTFKAFALRQVPIWFAVPGLVQQVRQLGFDLFDDIVDHSYDNDHDQMSRYNTIFEMIKKFDQHPLQWYQDLRIKLDQRLENNVNLLRDIIQRREEPRNLFLSELDS
jgi:hypothetical protein